MGEVWKPSNRLRAICLHPLRLDNHEGVLADLQTYVAGVQAQIEAAVDKGETWHQIESVDMVVIPVKLAGTWALYLTQRSTKLQNVIRLASRVKMVDIKDAPGALYNLDRMVHTLGLSVMATWLKIVVERMEGHGTAAAWCRVKAGDDIEANYIIVNGTNLPADVMSPGVAAMYLIQGALLWNQNQPAQLISAYEKLRRSDALGGQAAQYCRQRMQFAFAANQHVGRFSEEVFSDIPGLQETSGDRSEKRRQASASSSSGEEVKKPSKKKSGKGSHDHKREKKGKDKKKDRKHYFKRSRK